METDANVQKCHFGGIYLIQFSEAEGADLENNQFFLDLVHVDGSVRYRTKCDFCSINIRILSRKLFKIKLERFFFFGMRMIFDEFRKFVKVQTTNLLLL